MRHPDTLHTSMAYLQETATNSLWFSTDTVRSTSQCLKRLCKFVFVRSSSNIHQFW